MFARVTESTVTFKREFTLTPFDRPQPAGTYLLVTDEEQIDGLSFLAFRRTATSLHLPAIAVSSHPREVFLVDPAELDAALMADGQA